MGREDHPARSSDALAHGPTHVTGVLEALTHPAEQEDGVVGGQPEQYGEEHHGSERLDRPGL